MSSVTEEQVLEHGGKVMDEKLALVKQDLTNIKMDVQMLKTDVNMLKKYSREIRKDQRSILDFLHRVDVRLDKRVKPIEDHLGLPPLE